MSKTDAQLLAAAKIEKKETPPATGAFEAILSKYEKLIYYIARRYFTNHEDVLDAGQDAALKIYNGLAQVTIAEDGTLKAWICTVVARTCLDALRKNRVQTIELSTEVHGITPLPSAEETALANARAQEIFDAIKTLSADYRMIIILRDLQGLSYEEIAETLNINIGTVRSRLSRARNLLKKML